MAFSKLDRLFAGDQLLNKTGTPTLRFMAIWQKFAESIEGSLNNIADVLVRLGLVEVTADGALDLAEQAINPDGTIKDEKVITPSIMADAVTGRYFTQNISGVTLTDTVEVTVLSLSVVKAIDESDIDLDPCIRFSSNDDIRGTIRLYRGATLIDSFQPYMNGPGGTYRVSQVLPFTDSAALAGSHTYSLTFQRSGGASTVTALAGTCMRAKELKR